MKTLIFRVDFFLVAASFGNLLQFLAKRMEIMWNN